MAGILLLLGLCVSLLPPKAPYAESATTNPCIGDNGACVCTTESRLETSSKLTDANRSFLAGAVPLSMTLSQPQLRLLSSIGIGILVGTSLIVIIPEGIEAAATPGEASHVHRMRVLTRRTPWAKGLIARTFPDPLPTIITDRSQDHEVIYISTPETLVPRESQSRIQHRDDEPAAESPEEDEHNDHPDDHPDDHSHNEEDHSHSDIPTFEIGFSLISGFVLMFLIDRLPRHASEGLQNAPQTRHISLDNLGGDTSSVDEEADGFLGSLTPTPRRARSLATTTGLVIHAAADGIAMGASSTTSDMKLGFIIFIAIMIHKAPAAFGLTSVLLKQGLSKRAARGHLIVFSLAAPVGALSTWLLITLLRGGSIEGDAGQWWTGMLLLFSGGTFL